MPVRISESSGSAELTILGELTPGEAKEVRLSSTPEGIKAELAGLEAVISEPLAQLLIHAGAQDERQR